MFVFRAKVLAIPGLVAAMLLSAALTPSAAVAQTEVCAGANKITRLGNAATRFSPPVTSVGELQAMFSDSRSDVETLLRQAGFGGDPNDLFAAIASGDGVTPVSVDPGTRMGWMFAREKGNPELKRDVCWAGKAPFRGYEVQFSSQGTWYLFVIPEACGNLSFLAQQQEPVCKVSITDAAGETCSDKTITVDATGSTGNVKVELISPSGSSRTLTSANSSGRMRWTVSADETSGAFRAVASASEETLRGNMLTCRAEDSLTRDCCIAEPPSIGMSADPDTVEPFQETTVTGSPSVSECTTLEGVTMDGSAVSSPYQITKSYPEAGTYTVEGTVRDGRGQTSSDKVAITVTECQTKDCKKQQKAYLKEQRALESGQVAAGAWILRAWLAKVDMDDEVRLPADGARRESFHLDSGPGFGLQLERLFNDRVGLGFGLLADQPEVGFELDEGPLWLMNEDEVRALTLFVGPVFHLTPNAPVDLFFSPFVGYTDTGDADVALSNGDRVRLGFDNQFTYGALLGLDIPIGGSGWGVHAGARYQDLDLESDYENVTLGADPLSLNVGLRYSF